jgi:outer membrane protein TolC
MTMKQTTRSGLLNTVSKLSTRFAWIIPDDSTLSGFAGLAIMISGIIVSSPAINLQQAQTMMFFKNLDLTIDRQEYCQKDYELVEAKSAWYPSIDLFGSYAYQSKKNSISLPIRSSFFPSGPLEMGVNDRSDVGLELTYPVTAAIVNIFNVKSRQLALQTKSAQDMALRNRLSFKLGTLYFLWSLSCSQMNVKKLLVAQFEANLAQLANLQAGGLSSASKVLEARASLENAKMQLVTEENRTDSLRLEMVNFIRCDDSAIVPEAYEFNADSQGATSADTFSLNEFRPELAALDLSIDQLDAYNDVLTGRKYPNLLLNAAYHYGRPELQMSNDPDFMGYAVAGVQIRFNLFDGNKIVSQVQQTQQQIEILRNRKKQAINEFNNAIKSARKQYTRAKRQKAAALASLEAAIAVSKDVKNSLDAGLLTALDYQNALMAQATAELAVKQAEFMERTALLQVYFAVGKEIKF